MLNSAVEYVKFENMQLKLTKDGNKTLNIVNMNILYSHFNQIILLLFFFSENIKNNTYHKGATHV